MNPLRRLAFTAALAALIVSASAPSQAYNVQPDNARVKVDFNWTNATVYFNRSESRAIVAGSTAFLNRTPVWVKIFVTAIAGYATGEVNRGKCIWVRRTYAGQNQVGFYTGGYCR
jgi:hypothetical protein